MAGISLGLTLGVGKFIHRRGADGVTTWIRSNKCTPMHVCDLVQMQRVYANRGTAAVERKISPVQLPKLGNICPAGTMAQENRAARTDPPYKLLSNSMPLLHPPNLKFRRALMTSILRSELTVSVKIPEFVVASVAVSLPNS